MSNQRKHDNYPIIEFVAHQALYVTIDGWVFYIDNTTNEQIMECWKNDGTDGMYNKRVLVK